MTFSIRRAGRCNLRHARLQQITGDLLANEGIVAEIEASACVTCGTKVSTSHCPDCGERAIGTREFGLRQLLLEAFHCVTHVDSRLLRRFRALLFHPGALTTAYLEGPCKPYISPLQLFLIANLLRC